MLGYLKADNPGVLTPPEDGWHDTSDIVAIDRDGYLTIKGRAKRFAKIGGRDDLPRRDRDPGARAVA
jgi:acyl-[acyl-carrier-protein]-phospholipid O-acyltransferase / long-chain-fatty-acid--[acyl-carrier-protein] ligase